MFLEKVSYKFFQVVSNKILFKFYIAGNKILPQYCMAAANSSTVSKSSAVVDLVHKYPAFAEETFAIRAGDNVVRCVWYGDDVGDCVTSGWPISLALDTSLLLPVWLLLLLFSLTPTAIDATEATASLSAVLFLRGFTGEDSCPSLVELLLLSTLLPLKYLGGGWTVADVTEDADGFEAFGLDVSFRGDEWKPNRFLLALFGLIVAVGGGFFFIDGEEDVGVFVDILVPGIEECGEAELWVASLCGSLFLVEGATTPTIALGII